MVVKVKCVFMANKMKPPAIHLASIAVIRLCCRYFGFKFPSELLEIRFKKILFKRSFWPCTRLFHDTLCTCSIIVGFLHGVCFSANVFLYMHVVPMCWWIKIDIIQKNRRVNEFNDTNWYWPFTQCSGCLHRQDKVFGRHRCARVGRRTSWANSIIALATTMTTSPSTRRRTPFPAAAATGPPLTGQRPGRTPFLLPRPFRRRLPPATTRRRPRREIRTRLQTFASGPCTPAFGRGRYATTARRERRRRWRGRSTSAWWQSWAGRSRRRPTTPSWDSGSRRRAFDSGIRSTLNRRRLWTATNSTFRRKHGFVSETFVLICALNYLSGLV